MKKFYVIGATVAVIAVVVLASFTYLYYLRPGSEGETLKIGFMAPLTGWASATGTKMRDAAILAVEEVNNNGGILGKDVVLLIEDTEASPEKAKAVLEKLIDDGAVCLTGVFLSSEGLALSEEVAKFKIPLMITNAMTDAITQNVIDNYAKYKYVFRNSPNVTTIAYQALISLEVVGAKKYVCIADDLKWAHDYVDVQNLLIQQDARFENMTCLETMFVDESATDFSSELLKIRTYNPDAVLAGLSGANGLIFAQQYYALNMTYPFIGTSGDFEKPDAIDELGDAYIGKYVHTLIGTKAITSKTLPYFEAYREKYGVMADFYSGPVTYDSIYIFADAFTRAGTTDGDAVVSALEQTHYVGVCGTYVFGSGHQAMVGLQYVPGSLLKYLRSSTGELEITVLYP